ncbi:MAG TPA: cytochrome c oxidase subunit II transmembrane domain-containing protein [Methylomirabilota bacterium]|nr:cytochrome c oxidase subunit II transmembrane domain-containing protein [Methylomirabilota bacterium]
MKFRSVRLVLGVTSSILAFIVGLLPSASAQSPQVEREWALFNQILMIGIVVGIVVFGLLFYAIIRYREKPERKGAQ